MGTDIHCFTEKYQKNGSWKPIGGFLTDAAHYYSDIKHFQKRCYTNALSPFCMRNYIEFAILANVRNGRGFAGCDTGDPVKPISLPKGLPESVSPGIRRIAESWGCDGHSHSWLTVREILEYKRPRIVMRGYVSAHKYVDFLKTGNPYPCSSGIMGANVEVVPPDKILQLKEEQPDVDFFTQIQWTEKSEDSAEWLFKQGLQQLKDRCESAFFDDVRIVFWFDN